MPGGRVLTVAEWLVTWLDTRARLRESTRRGYAAHIDRYLIPHLGMVLLAELHIGHLENLFTALLKKQGMSAATARRVHSTLAELAAGLALAVVAARASSAWELAALAWLVLLAVPLSLIDVAVHRLPDPLTASAFVGTLALLAVTALADRQPGHLGRAAIGAVALACFYLILSVIRPSGLGLGDAKLAASTGAALGWVNWQALLSGTLVAFALAGVYGGALLALHRATRTSHLPLGPFILLGTLAAIAFEQYVGSHGRCRNLMCAAQPG